MSCIQQGMSNKCVCKNCNNKMGINNISHLNQPISEVNFDHLMQSHLEPIKDRLDNIEKHTQSDWKISYYEPPKYYKHGQEFNYPYKYRNYDNIWFHNEGGDFGGHSLYENPYVGPRNTRINPYAYGPHIPYYHRISYNNPYA